jgi:hypothetical protein
MSVITIPCNYTAPVRSSFIPWKSMYFAVQLCLLVDPDSSPLPGSFDCPCL